MYDISVNKVVLIGPIDQTPEFRQTQTGTSLCTFRISTTERFIQRDGQVAERTTWNNVVVWGRLVESARELLAGQRVFVEGRLQTRSYDDRDGNKRYITEVNARTLFRLDQSTQPNTSSSAQTGYQQQSTFAPPQQQPFVQPQQQQPPIGNPQSQPTSSPTPPTQDSPATQGQDKAQITPDVDDLPF